MQNKALGFLLLATIAVIGCNVRSADAYSKYSTDKNATTNCGACHGEFSASPYVSLSDGQSWGNSLHYVHRTIMLNDDCTACHSGRKTQVYLNISDGGAGLDPISCMGCHGRTEGAGASGYGAGLRQHHTAAGVYVCIDCHTDADPFSYTPVGEEVLPPYYANPGSNHPNIPYDPCNLDANESFAGSADGLDNDGDSIYDALDADCTVTPPAPLPDIAVTDSKAPADDLQIDFGVVTVGNSIDHTVTVTNTGSANLQLGDVASADPLAAPFNILPASDACSGTLLAPSDSCGFTVRFSPDTAIEFIDSFDIPSDAPNENPVTVSLAGTGTAIPAPDIAVSDTVMPTDDLTIDFGVVILGRSADHLLTVSNVGSADLTLGNVAAADPLAAPFSVLPASDGCSGAVLPPSDSCSFTVRFAPDTATSFSDTLDIPSDDPDENPVAVNIGGTGIANSPPSQPALLSPADGALALVAPVTFEWTPSTDPDGDTVTYDLYACTDSNFTGCAPLNSTPITVAVTMRQVAFASTGIGMAWFGFILTGGFARRRGIALLMVLALGFALSLAACGGGGGDAPSPNAPVVPSAPPVPNEPASFTSGNLAAGTTYYWKVVASDGTDSTESEIRSFTTL